MGLFPKLPGEWKGIDVESLPPISFIAGLMELPMVATAERHRKLIADFDAQCSRLGKTKMVWVRWMTATNETRL